MQQITGQKLIRAAGYTVMLEEVGPNVVATGSGALNVTGLTFFGSSISASWIVPYHSDIELGAQTYPYSGPINVDAYSPVAMSGPNSFGAALVSFPAAAPVCKSA
jgi:hypothetical protein